MITARHNLSMLMDLYQLTMANSHFLDGRGENIATYDVFYRTNPDNGGFAIFGGLEQVLTYLESLHFDEQDLEYLKSLNLFSSEFLNWLKDFHFRGDIKSMPEGSIIYPNEPIMTINAPLIDAVLIEAAILNEINHQSLIATKAQRMVRAANGRLVADFGARRAHNADAATFGARAAYIGGVCGTSTVLAGQLFDIPVTGTMAHSYVMAHDKEYDAFANFSRLYPDNSVLLVDTYDVLHSGLPNAIKVAHEVLEPMGKRLKGIRLDSGDLAYISKEARKILDSNGLEDCKIVVSNSLDEFTILSLLEQGAKIDSFGIGERLITAKSDPVFGAVYKLVALHDNEAFIPKIKVSEDFAKITNPGKKRLWRIHNEQGYAIADLITTNEEAPDMTSPYRYIDPKKPWKNNFFRNCTAKLMQERVMHNGKILQKLPNLSEIRSYVREQLDKEIYPEEQRFDNPHIHPLVMSPAYYTLKMDVLKAKQFFK